MRANTGITKHKQSERASNSKWAIVLARDHALLYALWPLIYLNWLCVGSVSASAVTTSKPYCANPPFSLNTSSLTLGPYSLYRHSSRIVHGTTMVILSLYMKTSTQISTLFLPPFFTCLILCRYVLTSIFL